MRKLLIGSLMMIALAVSAYAQVPGQGGANGRGALNNPGTVTRGPGGFEMTAPGEVRAYSRSVTGKIVKLENGSLVLENNNGKRITFIVDGDARLRADKKTELADKKEIALGDYKPGQMVKVIYRVSDIKVLEVRLKPLKDKDKDKN